MQMVKRGLAVFLTIWIAILLFMPKQQIYFKLEEVLGKQGIKLNEERVSEDLFGLTLEGVHVYMKGVEVAKFKGARMTTLLFYTTVSVEDFEADKSLASVLPADVTYAEALYALWDPLNIRIEMEGSFGGARGVVSLSERTLHVDFNDTKGLDAIRGALKKGEKGWYYEADL